ncbi:DUF4167 domain-containing protein [Dongia deserti]|uniref:DUF4167 domain-containing protein n=1 Tax=Dongia deserti TaxID=2268030 RepID=UPI000E6555EF|nr:DUF4167 domain-containing protein [Dongia deserti]
MKQNNNNNNNRRARGRGPRKPHGMGGGQHKVQSFDSSGQEVRVRGNAYQVLEKYLQLARDAGAAGDRIAAENFLQHADHYYRVLSAMNDGQRPRMGGRELSVADVNVQNVSQGLSAAMYNSGGPGAQGIDGMQGDNPGNQAGQSHGHQGQSGHRQGGHQHGQHGQQGRSHGDGQASQPVSGSATQPNGHGNNYGNYRADQQPSYTAPSEPAGATPPVASDDQPDYPEELLPSPAAPAEASEAAAEEPEEGVQRTVRAPRQRLRGPRRGSRQGDGRGNEARQTEAQGRGQADPE